MKSLNDRIQSDKLTNNFSKEILEWLHIEGFNVSFNYSDCCSKYNRPSELKYEEYCYYKSCGEGSKFNIGVYVFSYGIGVDIDYKSGGNMTNCFYSFEKSTFEETYDKMVNIVNEYKY